MKATLKGSTLTIEVELDPKGKSSSTGKSTIKYTSRGFVPIGDGTLRVNLTVISK